MAKQTREWHREAALDLVRYGESRPPASGRVAGRIFEFVGRLSCRRAARLPMLPGGNADIRWWDISSVTVYLEVGEDLITVLHVGPSTTDYLRAEGSRVARSRAQSN